MLLTIVQIANIGVAAELRRIVAPITRRRRSRARRIFPLGLRWQTIDMPCPGAQPRHISLRIVPTHADDWISSGLRKAWSMPIAVRGNEGAGWSNRNAAIGVR